MKWLLSSSVAVSLFVCAPAAEAQWRAERPYRGLFAGGVGETEQLLAANVSLGTGWDDNLAADALGRTIVPSDVNREFRGSVSTGSAGLSYSLTRAAFALGASAGTTGRYYPSIDEQFVRRDYGSVGTSVIVGRSLSLQANAVYQPYNLSSMMPTLYEPRLQDPVSMDEDFPASLEHYFAYAAGAGFTRALTSRQTFSATYNYRAREEVAGADAFENHAVAADLTYLLRRDLSLTLGYGYSEARYASRDRRLGSHLIDVGVNYNRALSFSRRTTIAFATGSSAMRRSRNESLRFRANVNARLNHEIGRTWNASLLYYRGLQMSESWPEPVFSDSAVAGITGLVNSRIQVHVTARALRGASYFNSDGNGLENYGGSAGLSYAVTRSINTGLTYTYYRHDFSDRALLAPGFTPEFERQSVRAFVSLWVPLFQTARRP